MGHSILPRFYKPSNTFSFRHHHGIHSQFICSPKLSFLVYLTHIHGAEMAAIQTLPDDAFGDFVRNWDDECDLKMVVEPCDRYDPESTSRVFYPICLGEVLNGRYLIEHKIGFGGGSTVWMAHDLLQRKDVALKVMALGEWAENEIRMQNEIFQHVQDTSSLVTYLDAFILPRDNDHHQVLVFPLMGPCVDPVLLLRMPPTARMPAARKLLEALKKLHQAGIVHRGE